MSHERIDLNNLSPQERADFDELNDWGVGPETILRDGSSYYKIVSFARSEGYFGVIFRNCDWQGVDLKNIEDDFTTASSLLRYLENEYWYKYR
jgi:hypothetical protein